MAWHSGKPADSDFLSASVQHIRENFAELEPLQPRVAELVDLTTLHPHIAALLNSRIVEHNLDVADPPNGWYVRFETGLQICWHDINLGNPSDWQSSSDGNFISETWEYPAEFVAVPTCFVDVGQTDSGNDATSARIISSASRSQNRTRTSTTFAARVLATSGAATLTTAARADLFALGRWK